MSLAPSVVAVCGLPEPREDHAVAMALAANKFVYKMGILTKRLEISLGPDTGELNVRIGLHSGPVTAGKYSLVCLQMVAIETLN